MKKTLVLSSAIGFCCAVLVLAGCAHITVSKTVSATGTNVTFHGTSLLANSTLKSISVDATAKTTTSLLKASGATTEPNAEAITASAEGLGTIIGTAAATAARTAVK